MYLIISIALHLCFKYLCFQNQQARICLLYLPLYELLYQNLKQLSAQPLTSSPGLGLNVSHPATRESCSISAALLKVKFMYKVALVQNKSVHHHFEIRVQEILLIVV